MRNHMGRIIVSLIAVLWSSLVLGESSTVPVKHISLEDAISYGISIESSKEQEFDIFSISIDEKALCKLQYVEIVRFNGNTGRGIRVDPISGMYRIKTKLEIFTSAQVEFTCKEASSKHNFKYYAIELMAGNA